MLAEAQEIPPRPYLREEVYLRLKQYVIEVAAATATESPLREADLSRILGVSRTPIREALNRLHQEGLVEVIPRRGVRVRPSSLEEYLCWLEIREVIDGLAARLAAQHIKPGTIAEMRALFVGYTEESLKDPQKCIAFLQANATFHRMIIEASQNPLLMRLAGRHDYLGRLHQQATNASGRLSKSIGEHSELIDALESHDGEKAERLARDHTQSLRKAVSGDPQGMAGSPRPATAP